MSMKSRMLVFARISTIGISSTVNSAKSRVTYSPNTICKLSEVQNMKSTATILYKWINMSLLLFLLFLAQAVYSAEESDYHAITTDPAISDKNLPLILLPLTRDDIAGEVDAWAKILKDKQKQKIKTKIAFGEAGKEATEAQKKAYEESADKAANASKKFRIVMSAWENKGGDAEAIATYRQYLTTIQLESIKTVETEAVLFVVKKWIFSPEGGGKFAVRLAIFVVTLFGLLLISKFVSSIVRRATLKVTGMSQLLRDFLVKSSKIVTLILGILIVLSAFGLDMGPLLAVIGGASFIIAFAMQSTLSNFAAGLLVMIYRPFDIGDLVTLSGETGTVKSMNLVSTTIFTFDNQQVIIPNSNAWDSIIRNINGNPTRRVDLVFGTGYEDDMEKAKRILEDVVNNHPLVLKEPKPVVQVHALGESSVNYICRPWVKTPDYWTVYWDITRQVKECFDAEEVSIPYPQRDIHLITQTEG